MRMFDGHKETHIGNDIMFVNLMLLDFVRIREIGLNGRGDERICGACKSEEAAVANCLHCCSDFEVHRNLRDYVNLVRFECTNCRRENMIISFVYTELIKGTR
ncbi:hypothetical protein niasHT_001056 [Heterodera trifolii]|uniref:Uncharacterized protein n=1 Tax=Heterodera trifolii TaxID=157864 RepID=A0ABD2LMW4_9BILA